jgi:hypothetical protein
MLNRDAEKYKAGLGLADPIPAQSANSPARSAASLTLLGKDDAVFGKRLPNNFGDSHRRAGIKEQHPSKNMPSISVQVWSVLEAFRL